MGGLVELTWRTPSGKQIVETCYLLNDDDTVQAASEDIGMIVFDISNGMVAFEDDAGIFLVPPEDVINIRKI